MDHDRREAAKAANDRIPGTTSAAHGHNDGHSDRSSEPADIGGHRGPADVGGSGVPGDEVDAIQFAWERERPGAPAGSIGIITRIWRIAKLLSDERRRTLARLGIDAATLDLLSTLRRAGPPYRLTAGEIAEHALVSAGAISQRLARAEHQGLVTRDRTAADGRLTNVTLTSNGHALIERSVNDLLRHEEALLGALNQAQRADLTELLRTLLDDLTARLRPLPADRRDTAGGGTAGVRLAT